MKDVTLPKDESKITASDIAANAMAHAVVGAVVAQLSGQDAAAGAIGASSGELAARAIMAAQYPGKTANDLTEAEKQSVSALSTLAAGLVSGLAGNSTASAASGAQSGRNAVENNLFGKVLVEGCAIAAPCRTKIAEQLLEIGVKAGITAVVAKEIADKLSTEELEHLITLKMMGNDEITVRYLSSLQDKYLPSHTGGDQIVGQLPNNTGNTEGAPDLPNHYESGNKITQGEHATIRNKEGRPVGSVINDVQNSRPSDILVQDDGRWVVLGPKGRVHIIEPSGEVVTSMQNPKQNTNNRLQDGRWEKLNSDKLQEFKDKFSDYVRW